MPLCCFLTSFPSLCSGTAPQSTLPLPSSSSSRLLGSLFCTVVLLQCMCTAVVSAALSVRTDPEPWLRPKVESSSSVSQGLPQLLRVALLLDCSARMSTSLSPTLAWNTSAIFGSLSFPRSNRMQGLFLKRLVFSFNLMVVSTRS